MSRREPPRLRHWLPMPQVVVGPTGRAAALSNNLALPILADEHYVLAGGSAGARDERGWETDLLAGLGFTASGT